MNEKLYMESVNIIRYKVFKDGRPLYAIAPEIGITDCTLKRFLDGKGVNIYTVIQIADYFGVEIFN